MTKNDKANLISCYGIGHTVVENLEKMFDDKGQPKPDIAAQQIIELKKSSRELAAAANRIFGTFDGQPEEPRK